MTPSAITILYALIGGLILAGILGWIRKGRLALVVPKLFTYSQLSETSQLVELTVFNRGFKTEEAIEVILNPKLKYEIVGTTSQNVTLSTDKLEISRIGSSSDATVILLVENGQFGIDDVVSCVSKETTGKKYPSLELVPLTGNQRIFGLMIFLGVPALMLFSFLKFDQIVSYFGVSEVLAEIVSEKAAAKEDAGSLNVGGWATVEAYRSTGGALYTAYTAKQIQPSIGTPRQKGDVTTVPVTLINGSKSPIKVTLDMVTADSEEKIPSYERRLSGILVLPGKSIQKSINVIIPRKSTDEAERTVFIDCFIEQVIGTDTLSMNRSLVVDG